MPSSSTSGLSAPSPLHGAVALLAALPLPTLAAPAHVHGAAELRVVVDGERIEIALDSPLDNLLGFEHTPRTDAQRAAVRAMAARLRRAQTRFMPTAAARCALASVPLVSAALAPALLGQIQSEAATANAEPEGHADLDASFAFQCAQPALLTGMYVALLQAFSGLRKRSVQVVGPKGQSSTVLTPSQRRIDW